MKIDVIPKQKYARAYTAKPQDFETIKATEKELIILNGSEDAIRAVITRFDKHCYDRILMSDFRNSEKSVGTIVIPWRLIENFTITNK